MTEDPKNLVLKISGRPGVVSYDGGAQMTSAVVEALISANVKYTGFVRLDKIDLFLDHFADPLVEPKAKTLVRLGNLMTPDDLESFGLNRKAKIGDDFFLSLNPQGRCDPLEAAAVITQRVNVALRTRLQLERIVAAHGIRHPVTLIAEAADGLPCRQVVTCSGSTWAGVALDLPVPACDHPKCLCWYRIEIAD